MENLIGICGLARHGKDSIAQVLVKEFGFTRIAFADKLREVALAIDPFVVLPTDTIIRLSGLIELCGWEKAKTYPDVRRLLQRIGTEAGRNIISERLWLDLHAKESRNYTNVVVPDVRFHNEADYIHQQGGFLIRVTDPRKVDNGVGTVHPSEQFVNQLPAQIEISNDGTLEDLAVKVKEAVKGLFE